MDKKQTIESWLKKADHDLGMAQLAMESGAEFTDSICFHCQQYVEKILKAYLISLDINFVKTHSLSYLVDLIAEQEKVPEEIYKVSELLESYAVLIRYPADGYEPTPDDAKEAYSSALRIKEIFIIKFIYI